MQGMLVGPIFHFNYNAKNKIVVNAGGTSSGKTYSILQVLLRLALESKCDILVVGETIPSLKRGALKDFQTIINNEKDPNDYWFYIKSYNATDRKYIFTNGSEIQFSSFVSPSAAKAGKRDYTFIDEVNNVDKGIFDELYIRTRIRMFIAYNPSAPFWVMTDLIGKPDVDFCRSWHQHNPFLSKEQADKIENIEDPELWKVYARGEPGKIEGLYFPRWNVIDDVPKEAQMVAIGLDFGFSPDPVSAVAVYKYNGSILLDEIIYSQDLLIDDIFHLLKDYKRTSIVADSSSPLLIKELGILGLNVEKAVRGPDSIMTGIRLMQGANLTLTARSVNIKREFMTYKSAKDRNGNDLGRPIDFANHAIDAIRYVFLTRMNRGTGKYSYAG